MTARGGNPNTVKENKHICIIAERRNHEKH